jgi:hypothetical protein
MKSKDYYDKFMKKENEDKCKTCDSVNKFISMGRGYSEHCSRKCANLDENIQTKIKNTWMKNYGVNHPCKSDTIKTKKKITCLDRYGVENPMQFKEIKEKAKSTCLTKYGVTVPAKSKKIKEKTKQTNLAKYGVANTWQLEKVLAYIRNGGAAYANSFVKNPSRPQIKLFNLVRSIYSDAVLNYPCMNYSIDVAIPSRKIAIEYDGSYWHKNKEKDKDRQRKIEAEGWKVIRYQDFIPNKDQLIEMEKI